MGELARERSARDLWISRSHLRAAAAAVVLLCLLSFAAGVRYGQGNARPAQTASAPPPEGDLVELVARVEATSQPGGGVEKLTFPDALAAGNVEVPVPEQGGTAPEAGGGATVAPPPGEASDFAGDPAPEGAFTVVVGTFGTADEARSRRDELVSDGHEAWLSMRVVEGQREYRVAIGGYAQEASAQSAAAAWSDGDATAVAMP